MISQYKLINTNDHNDIVTRKIKNNLIPRIREYINGFLVAKYGNTKKIKLWKKHIHQAKSDDGNDYAQESYQLLRPEEPIEFVYGMEIYYTPPLNIEKRINLVNYATKVLIDTIKYNDETKSELMNNLTYKSQYTPTLFVRDKLNKFEESYKLWDGTITGDEMTIYVLEPSQRREGGRVKSRRKNKRKGTNKSKSKSKSKKQNASLKRVTKK